MPISLKLICSLSLALALAACGGETSSGQTAGAETEPSGGLSYSPRPLATCGASNVVEINWSLAAVSDADTVVITVVDEQGKENDFARAPASDSKKTGPWAKPGQVFVARNPATDQEITRMTLEGPGC